MPELIPTDDVALENAWNWAYQQFQSTRYTRDYPTYRDYYDGIQDLTFATAKFARAFGKIFDAFAYNRCQTVVDSVADRLKIKKMAVDETLMAGNAGLQEKVDLIWRFNRFDRKQGEMFTEALKCGDAYVIVWPEDVEGLGPMPRMYVNNADVVTMAYDDDTKQKRFAAKVWRMDDGFWRLTLYFHDGIWKYTSVSKKDEMPKSWTEWTQWVNEFAPEPWPVPNPFGEVPVFHIGNNSREGDYGRSEIAQVIPLQDALNKACTDMMVAMEYGALPQRWATGLQLGAPDPLTGKLPNPFKEGPGELWLASAGAQFGNFQSTDLKQFLDVQDSFDKKIANVVRIPSYWLTMGTGDFPSGEALQTADAPFVAKLEDRQTDFGQDTDDIYVFALKTTGVEGAALQPMWKSAELRSEQDMLDAATKKQGLGWSERQIMRELGLDESKIDQMIQERMDETAESTMMEAAGLGVGVPSGGGNLPPGTDEQPTA